MLLFLVSSCICPKDKCVKNSLAGPTHCIVITDTTIQYSIVQQYSNSQDTLRLVTGSPVCLAKPYVCKYSHVYAHLYFPSHRNSKSLKLGLAFPTPGQMMATESH